MENFFWNILLKPVICFFFFNNLRVPGFWKYFEIKEPEVLISPKLEHGSKGPYQFYTSVGRVSTYFDTLWKLVLGSILILGWCMPGYIDWCEMGITSCPYQPGTGIKLIPDRSRKLIPMLIPVFITVSDLIYQSNIGNIPASYHHQLKTILVCKFFKTYPIPVPTWYLKWNPLPQY